ncbi:hypothetical protein FRC00_006322 [Tulasnella sp. 408]|nr:hypothetical protein FRC00_006322 [Tulasnella sp. 408]
MVRVLGESLRELAPETAGVFYTLFDPTIKELVIAANQWFVTSQRGILPGALAHTCKDCTHTKRYRANGPPGQQGHAVAEQPDGAEGIGLGNPENPDPVADLLHNLPNVQRPETLVNGDGERVVRMAVMDGKEAGHALCNAPTEVPCRSPPLDFKQARFCDEHSAYNQTCGIVGCHYPVVQGSKVCARPTHQEFYQKWKARFGRTSVYAVSRAKERRTLNPQAAALPQAPLPPMPTLPADDPATPADGNVQHTFQATRTHCIQTLTWACGYPIAATKFYVSESESQCANWLRHLFPDDVSYLRPDYLAYDRACFLLRHLVTQTPNSPWVQDVRLIVDAWHYIGHCVSDILCRSRCNPAPTDGSQPDLIINEEVDGRQVTRRAFNTEAAEQLNSWLDGYKGTLNRMTDYNFDFVLYCILFLRAKDWEHRKGEQERQRLRGAAIREEREARRAERAVGEEAEEGEEREDEENQADVRDGMDLDED